MSARNPSRPRRALSRSLKVAVALGLCTAIGAVPAFAWWSTSGSGTATATASTLTKPAAPTVNTPTASSLKVSGTLPGAQLTGTTYKVLRGATPLGCTMPASGAYSCTDTGLSGLTTYSYTVVASLGSWTSASTATTGTTTCATSNTFAVVPAGTATAGAAFSVTVTAYKCDGTVDTSYTGAKTLAWSGLGASPSGKAPAYPASATFASGVATVQVTGFLAGPATVTAADGVVNGSGTLTINPGAVQALGLTNATSGGVGVTVSCPAGQALAANRTCSQVGNGGSGNKWRATVQLLDTWGNLTTNSGGNLAVSVSGAWWGGSATPSGVTIPAGGSSATFEVGIGWLGTDDLTVSVNVGGTRSISLSIS